MFAGMKKKKSKKSLANTAEGDDDAIPATAADDAPAEEGDELDFSNLKKKKKKRVVEEQVAALDAQLEEAGVLDEKFEGEDPFAKGEGEEAEETDGKDEEEAWLKSDREYTYEEVHSLKFHLTASCCIGYSAFSNRIIRLSASERKSVSPLLSSTEKVPSAPSLQIFTTWLFDFTGLWTILRTTCLRNSARTVVSMHQIDSS